jgi:hypothetical protein
MRKQMRIKNEKTDIIVFQVDEADKQLRYFQQCQENHLLSEDYLNFEEGTENIGDWLHDIISDIASNACEGSHKFGRDEYTFKFKVGDKRYAGTAKVDYNRHDKTYYYVEDVEIKYEGIV